MVLIIQWQYINLEELMPNYMESALISVGMAYGFAEKHKNKLIKRKKLITFLHGMRKLTILSH